MKKPPRTTCPDCDGPLRAIKVLDHTAHSSQVQQQYTAADAKRSFWGIFPVEGAVTARVCEDCGRILLYAEPGQVAT